MNTFILRPGHRLARIMVSGAVSCALLVVSRAESTATLSGRVQDIETGRYLNNARITIKGTTLFTFSDPTGSYRLANVAPGRVVLEAFYTGLDAQRAVLDLAPAQKLEHDFSLGRSGAVQMDKVVVRGARDLETIAINEQRFAPNIKIVAAPRDGVPITDGNVGEFMKTLPGVALEYYEDEVQALTIRGFDSSFVGVTLDGAALSAVNGYSSQRGMQTPSLSMNNVSRVEITHVPTPSMAADSLGGAINLISKSAFERNRTELDYSMFFTANQHAMTLAATADRSELHRRKVLPGFTLNYTLPMGRDFGLVLSLDHSRSFDQANYLQNNTYSVAGTSTGASVDKPYLQVVRSGPWPEMKTRTGAGIKTDWRITPNLVLSLGLQGVAYNYVWDGGSWSADAGGNGTPVAASGMALSYGPDFTHGAMGRGSIRVSSGEGNRKNSSLGENLRFRFDNGLWWAEGGVTNSKSLSRAYETGKGMFHSLSVLQARPARVNFDGIAGGMPASVQVFDNNNQLLDPADIRSYRLAAGSFSPNHTDNAVQGVDASLRRHFTAAALPLSLQIGATETVRTNDTRVWNDTYNYNGPQDLLYSSLSVVANRPLHGNYPSFVNNFPWASPRKLYAAWQQDPSLFAQTPAQAVSSERYRIGGSKRICETVDAAYVQGNVRLFHNRLNVLTGVRWEKTRDVGLGPFVDPGAAFVRDASGAFVQDAQGRRVRRPEAGAAGSMEELRVTDHERAYRGKRIYDGYFPSLSATYSVTEKFQVRFGWAKTYGRPNYYQIIPSATISQSNLSQAEFLDPAQIRGNINVTNPALKPWRADNYDLTLEYYSDSGGLATASLFTKNVKDFFGSVVKPATAEDLAALGLDPTYVGWQVSTKINTDSARISGVSLNLKQSLAPLGAVGRCFSVFGNATLTELKGSRQADFWNFNKRTANCGFSFTRQRVDVSTTWSYTGMQDYGGDSSAGPDGHNYGAPYISLDLNASYRLTKHVSFFAAARNLFNHVWVAYAYAPQTPDYARRYFREEYGTRHTAGIKGTF